MDDTKPQPVTADPSDNTTLTDVIDGYRAGGYDGDFFAEDHARVRCATCQAVMPADELAHVSMRRLEGASDPDDMVAVLASVCPRCETRGTLVVGLGPMASSNDGDVLLAMVDDRGGDPTLPPDASPHEAVSESEVDKSAAMDNADTANGENPAAD